MPDPIVVVSEQNVTRLRAAFDAWRSALKKWPPAVNETIELRRAIVALLKAVRTWGPY